MLRPLHRPALRYLAVDKPRSTRRAQRLDKDPKAFGCGKRKDGVGVRGGVLLALPKGPCRIDSRGALQGGTETSEGPRSFQNVRALRSAAQPSPLLLTGDMCQGSCGDMAVAPAAETESLFSSARWPNLLHNLKKALAEPGVQVAARGPDGELLPPPKPFLLRNTNRSRRLRGCPSSCLALRGRCSDATE